MTVEDYALVHAFDITYVIHGTLQDQIVYDVQLEAYILTAVHYLRS